MAEEMQKSLAQEIAETLGETQRLTIKQIETIVQKYGEEGAIALLQETLEIEANGGMLINEGTRRRTIGGIFFHLALTRVNPEERPRLRQDYVRKTLLEAGELKRGTRRRFTLPRQNYHELIEESGEVIGVKIILTGRPGRMQTYKDLIVTTMKGTGIPSQFPKGVPAPPTAPTNYVIYISAKQWRKIAESMENPEDQLIVEGYCNFDQEAKAIGVYATSVTTRLTRIALKDNQKGTQEGEVEGGANANGAAPAPKAAAPKTPPTSKPSAPAAPKSNAPAAVKPAVAAPPAPPTPSISREEATAKLKQLYKDEDEAREAMEEIKSLPPNEQTGLGEALRELQRIKNDIRAIKQMYPGL